MISLVTKNAEGNHIKRNTFGGTTQQRKCNCVVKNRNKKNEITYNFTLSIRVQGSSESYTSNCKPLDNTIILVYHIVLALTTIHQNEKAIFLFL